MQFRDLNAQYMNHKDKLDGAISRVLDSSRYIGGDEVKELEKELAAFAGTKHCISCGNGTDALELVLMAWGIGPGDAIFVPSFTFFASAEVVASVGATPVFCDVLPDTFNLDPTSLEQAIQKTIEDGKLTPKAIIPVDLFGLPADYPKIQKIADKYNLLILEDGAQGFGGHINIDGKVKRACSFGDAATTSFFPAKPLGCYGDGGAIFTNDDALAELLSSLKVHGKGSNKYDNIRIGINSRLDTIQAAILREKLIFFKEEELEAVQNVFSWYSEYLSDLADQGKLILPTIPENYYSSFAQYTIRLNSNEEREILQNKLKEAGIPTMIYYPRGMHQQTAFQGKCETPVSLEVTENLCDTVLSLPMHPYLNEEDILKVCQKII